VFGWRMCKENWVDVTIRKNCHTSEVTKDVANKLTLIYTVIFIIIFIVVMTLTAMQPIIFAPLNKSVGMYLSTRPGYHYGFVKFCMFSCTYISVWGFLYSSGHLIASWLRVCMVKYNVNRSLAESATVESIQDDTFIETYFNNINSLSVSSSMWSVTHVIRFITCVPTAWAYIYTAKNLFPSQEAAASLGINW
jgi:hypothetical protein